jgi:uncharacterized protein YidB (DUF937 family)
MGLLDGLAGQLLGQISGGNQYSTLLPHVLQLLQGNQPGSGIQSLIQSFNNGGLEDIISSWIGTGSNLRISPSQLQNVLGSDTIGRLASQSGLSTDNVRSQLADLLPQVVDRLTPNGQLPAGGDLLSNLTSGLKGLF